MHHTIMNQASIAIVRYSLDLKLLDLSIYNRVLSINFGIMTCTDPCQEDLNPCEYGICTANATTGDYQCHCDIGYEGINCTEEINECLSNPCLNNG